jgi:hypothetical protein
VLSKQSMRMRGPRFPYSDTLRGLVKRIHLNRAPVFSGLRTADRQGANHNRWKWIEQAPDAGHDQAASAGRGKQSRSPFAILSGFQSTCAAFDAARPALAALAAPRPLRASSAALAACLRSSGASKIAGSGSFHGSARCACCSPSPPQASGSVGSRSSHGSAHSVRCAHSLPVPLRALGSASFGSSCTASCSLAPVARTRMLRCCCCGLATMQILVALAARLRPRNLLPSRNLLTLPAACVVDTCLDPISSMHTADS